MAAAKPTGRVKGYGFIQQPDDRPKWKRYKNGYKWVVLYLEQRTDDSGDSMLHCTSVHTVSSKRLAKRSAKSRCLINSSAYLGKLNNEREAR